jgi:hypothetical protein
MLLLLLGFFTSINHLLSCFYRYFFFACPYCAAPKGC